MKFHRKHSSVSNDTKLFSLCRPCVPSYLKMLFRFPLGFLHAASSPSVEILQFEFGLRLVPHLSFSGQLYNALLSILLHSTYLQNRTDSGAMSVSPWAFICLLVMLFSSRAEHRQRHNARPCSFLCQSFTCFCRIISYRLFPLTGFYMRTHLSEAVALVYV